jgi:TRAP-type C4-dicarboxylate transport system permease small subunit
VTPESPFAPTTPRWRRAIEWPVEDWIGCALAFAILVVMSVQVFLPYVLNQSLIWSDELARYLLVAMAFIGCATGMRKGNHIRIDVIDYVLPPVAKRALWLLVDAAVFAYLVYVVFLSLEMLVIFHRRPSTAMGVPMSVPYAVITVGFGLAALRLALRRVLPPRDG